LVTGVRLQWRGSVTMSEAIHETEQEFWVPPAPPQPSVPALAQACAHCNSEFMVGARFCHVCGASREQLSGPSAQPFWIHYADYLKVLRALEFYRVKEWLGLPMASLVSFLVGMGCVLAAMAVGVIYSVENLADFQAIQLWRIEWLLGAVAAFLAGILLKRAGSNEG
jgi:hypothetical protein